MTQTTIGIDISKDTLDVHRLPDGAARQFANTKAGHRALIAWIGADVVRIVFEPTGPYHRALEMTLAAAGRPLCKVNPRQARRFAEATGRLAKTDRCDAAMLARMGLALDLESRPVNSQTFYDLKELLGARDALIKDRTAAKNRQKRSTIALLKRQNDQRLKQIDRQIAAIEEAIEASIKADPELKRRFDILTSIPGIGPVAAFALIIEMPELGSLEGKQAASLAGLAPITRQSGRWKGKDFIQGGRANLRQALYMPALVATRFNADLKAKYDQLIAAGKPAKLAITAFMRKLIVLANALLRDNRNWAENTP